MTEMLLIWGMSSQVMQAKIKVGTPLASGTVVSQVWWQYMGSSVSPPWKWKEKVNQKQLKVKILRQRKVNAGKFNAETSDRQHQRETVKKSYKH